MAMGHPRGCGEGKEGMTAPLLSREEWERKFRDFEQMVRVDAADNASYSKGIGPDYGTYAQESKTEVIDSIMSLQSQLTAAREEVEMLKADVVATDALADSIRFRLDEANKLLSRDTDLLSIKIAIKAYLESYTSWISCDCSIQYEMELIKFCDEKRKVLFEIVGMSPLTSTTDEAIEKARQPK